MAKTKTQIEKFRETARALGADESEDRFTATLKAVAKHKPSARSPEAKRPARKVRKHPKGG